jgi:hypothetical protein
MTTARLAGLWFLFAAVTFWAAWVMMPDAGTNDAAHILQAVRENRAWVWWSALLHLLSSIAFVHGVEGVQSAAKTTGSTALRLGAVLVLVGALGVCADAFFHLMAYYLTADAVALTDVLEPFRQLQTQGIWLLVPLLLALLVGGPVYAAGLRRARLVGVWPGRMFLLALVVAGAGGVAVAGLGQGRRWVVIGFLGAVSFGYGWLGYDLAAGPRQGEPA